MRTSPFSPFVPLTSPILGMLLLAAAWVEPARGQTGGGLFTVQLGSGATPPSVLVHHTNNWSYRRGTSEPQANWQTVADAALDATWAAAPGGFGYGDAGIAGESTTLTGMVNVHSTLYIRKSFVISSVADTNLHLRLTVDYDDGFVAYLDGAEVARRNLTNAAGTFVAFSDTTVTSHEASCCDAPTHAAETIDLGAVGKRLAAGNHILAIIGVNGTLGSSDFHIIADLGLDGSSGGIAGGPILSVVPTNFLALSGSNTVSGSTRVVVNGDEADFNASQGTWSKTQPLTAGVNRLAIQALDAVGHILASTNCLIVADLGSVAVGGTLGASTVWNSANGLVRMTSPVVVPPGGSLTIQEGVVVLASANCSLLATNATLTAAGTADRPIYFLPSDGVTTNWGGLIGAGTNGNLSLKHIETIAGRLELLDGAVGTVEDAYLHDYRVTSPAIIHTLGTPNPVTLNLRRCYIARYHEVLCQVSTNKFEGCLLEYQGYSGDGIDFDAGRTGSFIRHCTLRRGTIYNTDALDMGEYDGTGEPTRGMIVESSLLHDFIDKGVSMGVNVDVTVTNCLIYHVDAGIAVKDLSTAGIYNNTIAAVNHGYNCYNKANSGSVTGGGFITNSFNNILWHCTNAAITLLNGSTLTATYCDFEGTNWPGPGNISSDPLFANAAGLDFHLTAGSPTLGTGLGGANMGVTYPVGGIPPRPWNLAALTLVSNQITLVWQEDADNEDGFEIQRSLDRASWLTIGGASANATNFTDAALALGQANYYRVRATNSAGVSGWSELAGATVHQVADVVGGTLASDTTWSPEMGPIFVASNVIVPANLTLTIQPGTVVKLTNNAMLVASTGGVIRILGTWDNRVALQRWNGANNWGELRAEGTNALLEVHFADISGGQTTVYYGAVGLIEDTFFHDFHQQGSTTIFNQPLVLTHYAALCTVRRCHMDQYYETLWRHGINVIEDSLFEHMNGDALDFDTGKPGSVIRRCTFQHGNISNVDAIDMGNDGATGTEGAIVEDTLMYDFPFDKGVSIGENSFNITVRNCLIHHVSRGIQVKDVCTANIYNCTITDAEIGIHGYEKVAGTGAGRVTNSYNNILWGLTNPIVYDPAKSVMVVNYTDTQGTNWPSGAGNINSDPLFANAAAGDWRLLAGSPCLGTGKDGANMGVTLPVGVFIQAPSELVAVSSSNVISLSWRDNSPSEAVFLIERSVDGSFFAELAYVSLNATNYVDTSVVAGSAYRYRVRGANILTNSDYSNEALAGAGLSVAITSPTGGALLRSPTNLTVAAVATSTTGSVARVEFFQNAVSLGIALAAPYTVVWSNAPAGSYSLTAVVTENGGRLATSAPVNVTLVNNFAPLVSIANPANGAEFLALTNIQIDALASDSDGVIAKVIFYRDGVPLGQKAAAPFSMVWSNVAIGSYSLAAVAFDDSGASATSAPVAIMVKAAVEPTTNTLIALGSTWKYLDNGSNLGTAWRTTAYDDSAWAAGPALLGFCTDGGCLTFYTFATVLGYGPDPNNKYITTYFRRPFVVDDPGRVTALLLQLQRDDGAVVYLNGTEIFRTNMPAGTITYTTLASAVGNFPLEQVNLPAGVLPALVAGTNTIAVEIHQVSLTSSDIAMDLGLRAVVAPPTNLPPYVSLTSPADGLTVAAPASLTLAASAFDTDGSVRSVEFRANGSLLGTVAGSPYSLEWTNVPAGIYALTAVAIDNSGLSSTSSVVTFTVSTNSAPPIVFSRAPAASTVTNLAQITVNFSKPVTGVDASDLLINGIPSTGSSGSGSNYTFSFTQPAYGPIQITWAPVHGIADVFTPPHSFDASGPGAAWQYQLIDTTPPVLTAVSPTPGAVVPELASVSLSFSESVLGVDAADLVINGLAASTVTGSGPGPYRFSFAQPANGSVQMSWIPGHGIHDESDNVFAGSPWTYSLDTNVAGVLISEIMYHPQSENTDEEYIELLNFGPTAVNLAGWHLSQGVRFDFPSVTLPSGGYLVVAANAQVFTNKYPGVTNVVGGWEGILSNSRNGLHLDDAFGRRVDTVPYATEGDWAIRQRSEPDLGSQGWHWLRPHDGNGSSLELVNPSLPNQYGQNWAASLATNGTPGQPNSVAAANIPPLILDVQHRPVIPANTDPVVVSARLLDERSSNVTATLFWRVDAASPPAFASTNMCDDGTHGDGVAGDGLFAATLPPQPQSAVVEFYVQARDQDGLTRTWPAPARDTNGVSLGQVCNALYQVDTNSYTGLQPVYRLIMTERERAALYQIQHGSLGIYPSPPGTSQSDAQMNGAFVSLDGTGVENRYLVGIRNRGHGTRVAHPNNYRVDFTTDSLWKNVTTLTLNGQYTHAQIFGAALAQRSGLAGADARAVQLRVNSTNLALLDNYPTATYGSYAATEMLNSDWAEHHFPGDSSGNIYRAVRDIYVPSASFDYRGASATAYTNTYFKNSNQSQDDWSDLVAMLRVMGTNDLFTPDNVRQVVNVEQWIRHLAVMSLMANAESGLNTGYNDDYFMYRGVNDPRFILVYYDLDTIIGQGNTALGSDSSIWSCTSTHLSPPYDSGTAMSRFLHRPEFEPIYYRTLQNLIDTTFSAAQFNGLIEEVLGGYVPASTLQAMTNWMNTRRAYVQSAIAPYVTPATNAPIATIFGEPRAITPLTTASLVVGGADIVAYRYQLNGGDYSAEAGTNILITLAGLPHGSTNVVRVIGKTAAGVWQSTDSPTVSRAWVVRADWPSVRLNEILARNDSAVEWSGQHPDLIELFNEGAATADLAGLRLTDDPANPGKFTFPAGTTLAAGGHLVVVAGNADGTPGFHAGFALDQNGEAVYLVDRATNGATVLDSVGFGLQAADFSIGRLGNSGEWILTQPTFGSANLAQLLGSPRAIRVNEWLAYGQAPFADDFIELYNPLSLPVCLGGLYLTDEPFGAAAMHRIAPLSFLGGRGYQAFTADGNSEKGANHLNFQLAAEQGLIGLMAPDLSTLDTVWYGPQTVSVAAGRCPDGGDEFAVLTIPTPGSANACPAGPVTPPTIALLETTNLWRFDQSGADLGALWRGTNFDDSSWPQGPGVLAVEPNGLPEPIHTTLTVSSAVTNFYFRAVFMVPTNANVSGLLLTHLIDDGAVFYLNGEEAYRYNMPSGDILASTLAYSSLEASYVGPLSLPVTNVHVGANLLAVEVHQGAASSSDIVFGCKLDLVLLTNTAVQAGLVLNEVLANNATLVEADGTTPDWVELYNPSDTALDLAGMSLSDSAADPRRWVFPPGATIPSRGNLAVRCDAGKPASADNTGFGLKAEGDSVYLFDKPANGGAVLDSVAFGLQAADFTIGRISGATSAWGLCLPTLGATNLAASLGSPMALKINEWMANPGSGADWFEICNPQATPVALGGLYLTDQLSTWNNSQIPALSFIGSSSNGFQRFWADGQAGADHVSFALKNSGEELGLYTASAVLIDGITFAAQSAGVSEGRLPDGGATRVFFSAPTPGKMNFLKLDSVVISEVLAHSDPPFEDAIEVQNLSGAAVDISGWWLSDSSDCPRKYQVSAGTILAPGGFAVFYEYQFNDLDHADIPFALSSAEGDEVWLSQADGSGALTGYRAGAKFGPSANGVSFGRYVTSTGGAEFPALSRRTFGADNPASAVEFRSGAGRANAYPLVGPVVISEIMYHPPDAGTNDNILAEFIELQNVTMQTVCLYDTNHPANTWRLRNAVDFDFPANTSIPPGGFLLVVSFDPALDPVSLAAFRAAYALDPSVPLVGPYSGKLANSDEKIELKKPDSPITNGVPYVEVESIHYYDATPWPASADGLGFSLQRLNASLFGNDPTNWTAAAPTPGTGHGPDVDTDGDGMPDAWELANGLDPNLASDANLDPDHDGLTNLGEYQAGTSPTNAASVLKVQIADASVSAGTNTILWFAGVAAKSYTVQWTGTLPGGWTNLVSFDPLSVSGSVWVTNQVPPTLNQRFYRVLTPRREQ